MFAVVNGIAVGADIAPVFTFTVDGVSSATDLGAQLSDCEKSVADGATNHVGKALVGYKVETTALQPAGNYSSTIMYIATPTFGGYSASPGLSGDNSGYFGGEDPSFVNPVISSQTIASQTNTQATYDVTVDKDGYVSCVLDTTIYNTTADILNHADVVQVGYQSGGTDQFEFPRLMTPGSYTLSCTTGSLANPASLWSPPVNATAVAIAGFVSQNKIIVADTPGSGHSNTVIARLKDEYDSNDLTVLNSRIVELDYSLGTEYIMNYAADNGADLVIQSTTGISGVDTIAKEYWPDIAYFMSLGSNSSIELTTPSSILTTISSCAGDTTSGCQAAYGDGLEFYDEDNPPTGYASSYSNGRVAAKMLKIKEGRNSGWWEARFHARETATRNLTTHPASNQWNKNHGFGIIDVASAIASTATLPVDPF